MLSALFFCVEAFAAKEYKLLSPNGKLEITITAEPQLAYSVKCDGEQILAPSQIGLKIYEGATLGEKIAVKKVKRTSVNTEIPTKFYFRNTIKDHYNALRIDFATRYAVEFRAYDEGVVYRFVTNFKHDFKLENEIAEFAFAKDYKGYFPYTNKTGTKQDKYFTSFESWYRHTELSQFKADEVAFVPVMIDAGKYKVNILEADVEHYPGMFVSNPKGAKALYGEFAPIPDKVVVGGHHKLQSIVKSRKPYIAECKAATKTPWRIVLVAEDANKFLDNDMVYRLASPSRVEDTSWIKPGKVAWEWWNHWGLIGVPFKAGVNTETYNYYTDFAAKYGIEYVILDEGWAVNKKADLFQVIPEIDLQMLTDYAAERNVGLILWAGYWAFDRDMEKVCEHYSKMGIKGFKVDFMDRDDQYMVDFHRRAAAMCAKYNMMVDFHGTYKPTGLHRTYPNVVNYEGVHGLEQMKWDTPETDQVTYDVTIPFIRMVAGPFDYTQGAMRNATKKNYHPVNTEAMSQGTRCRQLAEFVIFDSPFSMLCDSPSNYMSEAECTGFIADIPTVWDETKALDGKVSDYIVMARRSGDKWWVGAMTDWDARDLEIDLSFLPAGEYTIEIYKDGINADRAARDYKKVVEDFTPGKLNVHMAPGGGFAAKIVKK